MSNLFDIVVQMHSGTSHIKKRIIKGGHIAENNKIQEAVKSHEK